MHLFRTTLHVSFIDLLSPKLYLQKWADNFTLSSQHPYIMDSNQRDVKQDMDMLDFKYSNIDLESIKTKSTTYIIYVLVSIVL